MNEEILNFRDKSIRRLLAEAVAPQLLVDSEIEAMLTSADLTTPLSDEQLHRLVGKVQGLIETADDADRTVTSTALPAVVVSQSTHHAPEPRLVVVSTTEIPLRSNRKAAIASLLASLLALISVVVLSSNVPVPRAISQNDQRNKLQGTLLTDLQRRLALPRTVPYQMTAKQRPETPPVGKVAVGDEISTGERERRRVSLPDGSVLYVNSNAHVKIVTERRVEVTKGEVFVEVVPTFSEPHGASVQATVDTAPAAGAVPLRFEVITPERTITALGTKFAVTVEDAETDVTVTQGKVKVSGVGELVTAGKQLTAAGETILTAARSTSSQLEWTRDLMAAATGSLVAKSEYSGGALVTVDPHGQSSKLSLRNYHIDVHIEDGFARTTIDQTYFNHTHSRLEGTFHFPLPTDASLSRLAMYVNGKLMEGGMAERNHARNTFEEIKRKMLDPALLEWVDGSTFKMRVFPLEPRQEKRIVLSYSQRLLSNDGQLSYRFPAGHTMDAVRDWSAHVVVKGAAGTEWRSQSHAMTVKNDGDDLVLDAVLKNALLDRDLVLRVAENTNLKSQISNYKYDGQQYLMLRLRPELAGDMQRKPHHWGFIFEQAGDRTPLLARTQIEIIRTLLENAEHSDTFSIVTASSRAALYADEPLLCSAENIAAAVKYLENVHLVGALDLAAALQACSVDAIGRHGVNGAEQGPKGLTQTLPVASATGIDRCRIDSPEGSIELFGGDLCRAFSPLVYLTTSPGPHGPGSGYVGPSGPESQMNSHGGLTPNRSPVLVHVGSGMPALGERDAAKLAAMIPENSQYIGIGVGRRWNEAMMKQAASRTGGLSTQINPDEDIAWRAFDLFNKLHLPRLVNVECWTAFSSCSDKNKAMRLGPDGLPHPLPVASATGIDPHRMESPEGATEVLCGKLCRAFSPLVFFGASPGSHGPGIGYVGPSGPESQAVARGAIAHGGLTPNRSPDQSDDSNESRFLLFSDTVTQGEELAAICRIPEGQPLPQEITVTATLNGQPWSQTVAVNDVKEDASYLPRHWAKLEIDRLLAENATANRETIVALSKSMYVMSPFTSLLVLENDEMYTQFNVDRGRKDHWALYACPETIEVVVENDGEAAVPAASLTTSNGKTPSDVMSTVARLPGASFVPMDTPRLMTLDPTSAVQTLRNLNSNDGISAPVVKANVVVNGVFVLGTDNQILQTRQGIIQLDGNHHDYGNHSYGWIPQIADPELLNRYVRDINVVYDDHDLLIRRTIPFGRFQIQPGDLADPRRIRRGRTPLTEDKLAYFSGNALASDSDDLIQLKVQQQHFGLEHGWRTHESYSMSQQRTVGTHRWAADNVGFDAALVTLPTFQTEADDSFAINPTMFGDLMSYAPGLNTSAADVMAVVEYESSISNLKSEISDPPAGSVDEAARELIEKARGRGWESIAIGASDNEPGITILYDGQGRHVWERVVSEGLREHVVCDGETLWHVYREIGLASKRPFSRFHHQGFSDIVPWLLPSVEELSRGADVVALDERTVAVVPQTKSVPSPPGKGEKVANRPDEGAASGDASSNPTSGEEPQNPLTLTLTLSPESGERGQSQLFAVHLIFANDGRLAERRIVERDGGKVLRRITYDADGLVRVLDGDGKELIAAKFNRSIAPQPQLVPDLHGLVVLPMPVRKPSVIVARATDRDGKVDADQDLAEDDAISLMLAYMANGDGARVVEIARNRFLDNGDTRDGFYVLLSRFPMALVQATVPGAATGNGKSQSTPGLTTQGFDLRPPVEGSLLKQFVRQYVNWLRDSAAWQPGSGVLAEFRLDAP
ncbi:MAG: FecR domain-containing protein, partial [Planctomycetaceae bacterium]|nr:FecR domain-containing protein [Planctomycetaceae bacterium]